MRGNVQILVGAVGLTDAVQGGGVTFIAFGEHILGGVDQQHAGRAARDGHGTGGGEVGVLGGRIARRRSAEHNRDRDGFARWHADRGTELINQGHGVAELPTLGDRLSATELCVNGIDRGRWVIAAHLIGDAPFGAVLSARDRERLKAGARSGDRAQAGGVTFAAFGQEVIGHQVAKVITGATVTGDRHAGDLVLEVCRLNAVNRRDTRVADVDGDGFTHRQVHIIARAVFERDGVRQRFSGHFFSRVIAIQLKEDAIVIGGRGVVGDLTGDGARIGLQLLKGVVVVDHAVDRQRVLLCALVQVVVEDGVDDVSRARRSGDGHRGGFAAEVRRVGAIGRVGQIHGDALAAGQGHRLIVLIDQLNRVRQSGAIGFLGAVVVDQAHVHRIDAIHHFRWGRRCWCAARILDGTQANQIGVNAVDVGADVAQVDGKALVPFAQVIVGDGHGDGGGQVAGGAGNGARATDNGGVIGARRGRAVGGIKVKAHRRLGLLTQAHGEGHGARVFVDGDVIDAQGRRRVVIDNLRINTISSAININVFKSSIRIDNTLNRNNKTLGTFSKSIF